jgi:hypothetical protein
MGMQELQGVSKTQTQNTNQIKNNFIKKKKKRKKERKEEQRLRSRSRCNGNELT